MTALGYTGEDGGVSVNITQEWVPRTVAQCGVMPVEMYGNGQTIEVTVDLAEVVNWDLWANAFRMGEKQADGTTPTAINRFVSHDADATVLVGETGTSLDQYLILRPTALWVDADTTTVRDFVVPQAICTNVGEIPFGVETPQILPLTFMGIGNPAASDGEVLWYRGHTTAPAGSWDDA
jgi:hypothetical protein